MRVPHARGQHGSARYHGRHPNIKKIGVKGGKENAPSTSREDAIERVGRRVGCGERTRSRRDVCCSENRSQTHGERRIEASGWSAYLSVVEQSNKDVK